MKIELQWCAEIFKTSLLLSGLMTTGQMKIFTKLEGILYLGGKDKLSSRVISRRKSVYPIDQCGKIIKMPPIKNDFSIYNL